MVGFRPKYFSDAVKTGMLLRQLQIRPVTKIQYTFDPFTDKVASLRTVMSGLHTKNVLRTSVAQSKINVTSDRCDPKIEIDFSDGQRLIFKTKHLKASEILEKLMFYCNQRDTTLQDSDVLLTKMSGKQKKRTK